MQYDESTRMHDGNIYINIDYKSMQLKYSIYTIIFWAAFFFIATNLNEYRQVTNTILIQIFVFIEFLFKKKLKNFLENFYFFKISNIQEKLHIYRIFVYKITSLFHYTPSTTAHSAGISEYSNLNIFTKIGLFIRNFIYFFSNLKRSLYLIKSTFSINILWLIKLPIQISTTIKDISRQIKNFWRVIEQIIQIIRLPIEILILIGSFLTSVAKFLHRIRRPRLI